jgi:hypothetical protein
VPEIERLSKIISLANSEDLSLEDPDLTKSVDVAYLKQRFTRAFNYDLKNVSQTVFDQKDSNLCVPICVTTLLRWAIQNDLKTDARTMKEDYTFENIFTTITMILYPRSLAGLNLNPKHDEKQFQYNDVFTLLNRLKYPTFLQRRGWAFMRLQFEPDSIFDFKEG